YVQSWEWVLSRTRGTRREVVQKIPKRLHLLRGKRDRVDERRIGVAHPDRSVVEDVDVRAALLAAAGERLAFRDALHRKVPFTSGDGARGLVAKARPCSHRALACASERRRRPLRSRARVRRAPSEAPSSMCSSSPTRASPWPAPRPRE